MKTGKMHVTWQIMMFGFCVHCKITLITCIGYHDDQFLQLINRDGQDGDPGKDRVEMSERRRFPWDPRNSRGKGNGNLSLTEMGMALTRREWERMEIGQFPLKGKKN
jgi:hypothetical protein